MAEERKGETLCRAKPKCVKFNIGLIKKSLKWENNRVFFLGLLVQDKILFVHSKKTAFRNLFGGVEQLHVMIFGIFNHIGRLLHQISPLVQYLIQDATAQALSAASCSKGYKKGLENPSSLSSSLGDFYCCTLLLLLLLPSRVSTAKATSGKG